MGLSDDVLYVGILVGSVLSGNLVRKVPLRLEGSQLNPRKLVSTLLGIIFASLVSGNHILHILLLITLNAAIYKLANPKKCQTLSLVVSFLYLFIFRLSDRFVQCFTNCHFIKISNLVENVTSVKDAKLIVSNKKKVSKLPPPLLLKTQFRYII